MGRPSAPSVLLMLPIRFFSNCAIAAVLLSSQSVLADEFTPPPNPSLEAIKGATYSDIDAHKLDEIRNQAANVDMDKIAAEAKAAAANMQLSVNENEEANKAAQQAAALFNSPEFQNRLHQLQEKLPLKDASDSSKNVGKKEKDLGALAGEEKIYLFLSSSMPRRTFTASFIRLPMPATSGLFRSCTGLLAGSTITGIRASISVGCCGKTLHARIRHRRNANVLKPI